MLRSRGQPRVANSAPGPVAILNPRRRGVAVDDPVAVAASRYFFFFFRFQASVAGVPTLPAPSIRLDLRTCASPS